MRIMKSIKNINSIKSIFGIFGLSFILITPVALAADIEAGVAAYNAGDYEMAAQEFRPLAEAGVAEAQFGLGILYTEGTGVPRDQKQAIKWISLAAEQGHALAQLSLGVKYAFGEGVRQDYQRTYQWASLSQMKGFEVANELMRTMEAKMSKADIASAQQMARECLDSGYKNC